MLRLNLDATLNKLANSSLADGGIKTIINLFINSNSKFFMPIHHSFYTKIAIKETSSQGYGLPPFIILETVFFAVKPHNQSILVRQTGILDTNCIYFK